MKATQISLNQEAALFTHYLLGQAPTPLVLELYAQSVGKRHISEADQKLLVFIHAHPRMLGLIDAGLALSRSQSEVRRRLYVLFSILEATPEYAETFLPTARSPWYIVLIGLAGLRAVVKAMAGMVLVKVIG